MAGLHRYAEAQRRTAKPVFLAPRGGVERAGEESPAQPLQARQGRRQTCHARGRAGG